MITKEDIVLIGISWHTMGICSRGDENVATSYPNKIFSHLDVDFILFNSIECNIKIYEDFDSEHILDYLVGHINDKMKK